MNGLYTTLPLYGISHAYTHSVPSYHTTRVISTSTPILPKTNLDIATKHCIRSHILFQPLPCQLQPTDMGSCIATAVVIKHMHLYLHRKKMCLISNNIHLILHLEL